MESRNWLTAVIGVATLIVTGLIYVQVGKVAKSLEDLDCTCEEPAPKDPTPGPIITVGPGSGGHVAWTWGSNSSPGFGNDSMRIHPDAVGTMEFIRGVVQGDSVSQDITRWEVKIDDRIISAEEVSGQIQFFVNSEKVHACGAGDNCPDYFPPEFDGAFNGLALYNSTFPGGTALGDLASTRVTSP